MQALGCVRIGMCIGACYSTMYIKDLIICISCRIGGQNLCGQRAIHFEVCVQCIPEFGLNFCIWFKILQLNS